VAGGQDRRIEVRVDSSWVVIALLITSSMYQQVSQRGLVAQGGEVLGSSPHRS
jgi:hypothetical protein